MKTSLTPTVWVVIRLCVGSQAARLSSAMPPRPSRCGGDGAAERAQPYGFIGSLQNDSVAPFQGFIWGISVYIL